MKNAILFACAALFICACSAPEHPKPGVSHCSEPKMDEASHHMIQICGESEDPQIENMQCNENGLCFGTAKIRQPKRLASTSAKFNYFKAKVERPQAVWAAL